MERTLNKALLITLPNLTCFLRKRSAFHTCKCCNIHRFTASFHRSAFDDSSSLSSVTNENRPLLIIDFVAHFLVEINGGAGRQRPIIAGTNKNRICPTQVRSTERTGPRRRRRWELRCESLPSVSTVCWPPQPSFLLLRNCQLVQSGQVTAS